MAVAEATAGARPADESAAARVLRSLGDLARTDRGESESSDLPRRSRLLERQPALRRPCEVVRRRPRVG